MEENIHKKFPPARPWSPGVCLWTLVEDYHGNNNRWNSACGESILIDDDEALQKFTTCPFCSRELERHLTPRAADDADLCDCGEPFPESGSCKFCGARARHRR